MAVKTPSPKPKPRHRMPMPPKKMHPYNGGVYHHADVTCRRKLSFDNKRDNKRDPPKAPRKIRTSLPRLTGMEDRPLCRRRLNFGDSVQIDPHGPSDRVPSDRVLVVVIDGNMTTPFTPLIPSTPSTPVTDDVSKSLPGRDEEDKKSSDCDDDDDGRDNWHMVICTANTLITSLVKIYASKPEYAHFGLVLRKSRAIGETIALLKSVDDSNDMFNPLDVKYATRKFRGQVRCCAIQLMTSAETLHYVSEIVSSLCPN